MPSSTESRFATLAFPSIGAGGPAGSSAAEALERSFEESRVRGHAAGYASGLRAAAVVAAARAAEIERGSAEAARTADERWAHATDVLSAAVAAVQRATLPVLEQSDDALLTAALELAEAVIGRELSDADSGAAAALRRVLGGLDDADLPNATVCMHPEDVSLLRAAGSLPAMLSVQADPGIQRGDALAQLPDGLIDARIGSALERASRALSGEAS